MYVYIYMYRCMYIYIDVCICIYIYMCTRSSMCIYIYVYTISYLCVYVFSIRKQCNMYIYTELYIYTYYIIMCMYTYIRYIYIYILYIQTQCFLITVNIPGVCACPWISTGPCSLPGIGGGKVQGTERISVAADVGNPCCHQGIPSGDSSYQPFMVILGIVYYGFIVVNNGLSLVILDMMEPNNVHML